MWVVLPIAVLLLVLGSGPAAGKPLPRRPRGPALVPFTPERVFWRKWKNPKTKKEEDQYRTSIVETPQELADGAAVKLGRPVKLEAFVLATLVASEAGRAPLIGKVAVAHAARNMARKKGKGMTLVKLLLPDGKFGSQQGRYAATKTPPTAEALSVAEGVLSGRIKDPAGAIQWDSPNVQAQLVARGEPGYDPRNLPDKVARDRLAAGRRLVVLPGVDPNYLRLWA